MSDDESPAAVLGLLSDPIRIDVLRAFARAQYELDRQSVARLSFSEIYERVDADNTAKFSYHLGELEGTFVRKDEAGYTFTHAGEQVVRFILARNYEEPRDHGVNPTAGACFYCEAEDLEAYINHQMFRVECRECGGANMGQPISPAQARERDWDALVESIAARQASEFRSIHRGVCPQCHGRVSTTVFEGPPDQLATDEPYITTSECEECLRVYNLPLPYLVAFHPESIAFHRDHGVELTDHPLWEFHEFVLSDRWTADQVGTDPVEYRVVLRCDGDELRVSLDEDAAVTQSERLRR